MIQGRVIRILDERRVVVNVGTADGVEPGRRLGIYTPVDEVKDPKTGEVLGSFRDRKAIVRVTRVFEKFSVLEADGTERRRIPDAEERPAYLGIGGFGTSRKPRYEEVPATLNIDHDEEDPLPTGDTIQIGDIVEAPEPQ